MLQKLLFCPLLLAPFLNAAKPLDIYFIDVEGGQATLFVSPSGQSMLVDTGFRGFNGRDSDRIATVAKSAKVKEINYVVITHYHRDHVGGVPQLADRMKIGTFVDHGPAQEEAKVVKEDYADYEKTLPRAQHLVVKPGDVVPIKGINVDVLTSAGDRIQKALPGAGQPNPLCASAEQRDADPTENARSTGMLITYGKFRMLDIGDLTWNKELELVCPNNLIGTVDLYLTTHHGLAQSGPPALIHALRPRVAIMNNGARKGGAPVAWQIIKDSPGMEDIWQLHYSVEGGKEHNAPDSFIANVDETGDAGSYVKVSAESDGSFSVTNSRNKYRKEYKAR
jgi:beta-lactamase superfamily II metal-dependent hydrolase